MDVRNLKIDSDDMDRELSEQAGSFLYVAELAVGADIDYEKLRADVDRLEAHISMMARTAANDRKEKITEKGLAETVICDDRLVKSKAALIEARGKRDILKALREAWAMRRDTLLRLAMSKRDEMGALAGGSIPEISLAGIRGLKDVTGVFI